MVTRSEVKISISIAVRSQKSTSRGRPQGVLPQSQLTTCMTLICSRDLMSSTETMMGAMRPTHGRTNSIRGGVRLPQPIDMVITRAITMIDTTITTSMILGQMTMGMVAMMIITVVVDGPETSVETLTTRMRGVGVSNRVGDYPLTLKTLAPSTTIRAGEHSQLRSNTEEIQKRSSKQNLCPLLLLKLLRKHHRQCCSLHSQLPSASRRNLLSSM